METPLYGRYESVVDKRDITQINFYGHPMRISFPEGFFKKYGINKGEDFTLTPYKGRLVGKGVTVSRLERPMTKKEKRDLEEFIKSGKTTEQILKDMDNNSNKK